VAGTSVHNEHLAADLGPHEEHATIRHVQDMTTADSGLTVGYGLTGRLGLEAALFLRTVVARIEFEDLAGDVIEPADGDIHHRDETLTGPGDPWVMAVSGRAAGAWSLSARAGVSVPLGRTEANPFALGRRGLTHQHVQFGTGTWDPILGLSAGRRLGRTALVASALARLPLYENGHGYRAGRRLLLALHADRPVAGAWRAQAGLDLAREAAETWDGVVEEEGNLGRTDLLLSLGAARAVGGATLTLGVKVPLLTRANGQQLDYPVIVVLGVSR
jgi:hypothetical protein